MARFRKPFFRNSRKLWYIWHEGRQVNLGPDRDTAFRAWHDLTARSQAVPRPAAAGGGRPVVEVVDDFLDWCEKHRSPDTYRWYRDRLSGFCSAVPLDLTTDQLKPYHVQKWVDARPDLASGSRRNLIASVKRAMNWAEEQGYLERSPVALMRKPACGRKEVLVSDEEFARLVELIKDEEFRDLVRVSRETGARPQETLRVEARHVDEKNGRWIFPAAEAKGGKRPRVIYLTPVAVEITTRLMAKHPEGPLFRNTDGKPWTPDATNCRFRNLKGKLGKKVSLYSLRHSFATRALRRGIDSLTVAHLLGHSDPSMLAKHYAHLTQSPEFLSGEARRASV